MAIPRAENGKHGQRTWSISKTFHHVTSEASTGVQNTAVGNGQTTKNHSLFGSSQALSLWQFRYISITVWHPCQIIAQIALVNHKCHEWHCFRNGTGWRHNCCCSHIQAKALNHLGKHRSPSLRNACNLFGKLDKGQSQPPRNPKRRIQRACGGFPTNAWICTQCARTICFNLFE